ncbi:hypothetical protein [Spongiimicrobium salis]|uniref:hypothetical protein n=1 Tax=Spongiimicrobium salis TaxID=1667022 RepID=UPI00374DAA41
MSKQTKKQDSTLLQYWKKLQLPILVLIVLIGTASFIFASENRSNGSSGDDILTQKKDTLDKARHMGTVKLDTLKFLINEIGWTDKLKIDTSSWTDKATFSIESGVDKKNFHRIFYNNMTSRYLQDFGTTYFELHTTEDRYGFSCRYLEKGGVDYVEIPYEFLLGIVNERGRQRAGK